MRQDIVLAAAAFAASAVAVPYASAEKRQDLPSGYWDSAIDALPSDYWGGAQAGTSTSCTLPLLATTQSSALTAPSASAASNAGTTMVTSTRQITTTATTIPIATPLGVAPVPGAAAPVYSNGTVVPGAAAPSAGAAKPSGSAPAVKPLPTVAVFSVAAFSSSVQQGPSTTVALSSSVTALSPPAIAPVSSGIVSQAFKHPLSSSKVASASASVSSAASTGAPSTGSDEVAPAGPQVTNAAAFTSGAGNKDQTDSSSLGAGANTYKCYKGAASAYPDSSKWVHFADMWKANSAMMTTPCYGGGAANTPAQTQDIYDGIMAVAKSSLVDPRFVLAIVMQESNGCVNVGSTANGVTNPGIMQDHNGVKFIGDSASAADQKKSIMQMVIDGTQGTNGKTGGGDGLTQLVNKYGDIYDAARAYNSGSTDPSNLNAAVGATAGYVNDVANRMTGWTGSESKFPTCPQ